MSRQPIVVRQMDFDFPADIDPVVVEGDPEQSYGMIGLSLLLPYLEPYLIRTMKEAKKQVSDPELIDDLERFSAQEGQHYRQHMLFNDAIRLQGFPNLVELEKSWTPTIDASRKHAHFDSISPTPRDSRRSRPPRLVLPSNVAPVPTRIRRSPHSSNGISSKNSNIVRSLSMSMSMSAEAISIVSWQVSTLNGIWGASFAG